MKIGLVLLNHATEKKSHEQLLAEIIEQTRLAREAGFDLISTGQHYLASEYKYLQPVPLLSRLSAVSGQMSVSLGILLLPLHHPIEIAEQLTTMNTMADHVIAGVGAGYRDIEFESFGVPKSERAGRLTEGIELMKKLWTQETVSYNGKFYSVDDIAINPRPEPRPPIWVAANSPPAVERAARLGDAWYANPHSTISEIAELKSSYYDPIRRKQKQDTSLPVFREAFVASTTEAAVDTSREYLAQRYQQYLDWDQDEAMSDPSELNQEFMDLAEDRFILGTPEQMCSEIERYKEELNASHLLLRLQWPGMSNDKVNRCIELIGNEVIPHV